jgi:cell division protease FtsH
LIFHDPSTGASNDIEKATSLARAMVTQYGMTEAIGAIKLGSDASEPFMGRDYGHTRDFSESVAALVDSEIRRLIENAHQEAFDILAKNRTILDEMVVQLLERETLNKEDIALIFSQVEAWPNRPSWTGSPNRIASQIPPIATRVALSQTVDIAPVKKRAARKSKVPKEAKEGE